MKFFKKRRSGHHGETISKHVQNLISDIKSPDAHMRLASAYASAGRPALAHAIESSASFLQGAERALDGQYPVVKDDDLLSLNHNQYYRFLTLQQAVRDMGHGLEHLSILDVGGGGGELASFLPEFEYFLADPGTNGISSEHLSFFKKPFDFVVACHVLEHIPKDLRWDFLDGLVSLSRHGLVLLNPFHNDFSSQIEGLELVVELIGADWAKEHLQFTLPKQSDVEDWAAARGHSISVEVNGTQPFSLVAEFNDFYMSKLQAQSDRQKINRFLNKTISKNIDNKEIPTALLVKIVPKT